jgi:hypothetical protein
VRTQTLLIRRRKHASAYTWLGRVGIGEYLGGQQNDGPGLFVDDEQVQTRGNAPRSVAYG